MTTEDIIREVLDSHADRQLNFDSYAARNMLAKSIAERLDKEEWKSDYVDDDLSI